MTSGRPNVCCAEHPEWVGSSGDRGVCMRNGYCSSRISCNSPAASLWNGERLLCVDCPWCFSLWYILACSPNPLSCGRPQKCAFQMSHVYPLPLWWALSRTEAREEADKIQKQQEDHLRGLLLELNEMCIEHLLCPRHWFDRHEIVIIITIHCY